MIIFKVMFAVMVCMPVAYLAYVLFSKTVEDAAYGSPRKKRKEHKKIRLPFGKKKAREQDADGEIDNGTSE